MYISNAILYSNFFNCNRYLKNSRHSDLLKILIFSYFGKATHLLIFSNYLKTVKRNLIKFK